MICFSGLYNGAADHFTHEIGLGPIVGLDWHFANSSGSWVVRDEDQYYSTTAFADRVIDIVENHDESQVTCSATNLYVVEQNGTRVHFLMLVEVK